MKKILLILGILGVLILSACVKTDSEIEKEKGIDIIRDKEGDCFVVCQDNNVVKCGNPCSDKGNVILLIEERLSETGKKVCSDTGGRIIIQDKNELCECPKSSIIGATNKFSPIKGCNSFCLRGFKLENNQCVMIQENELCKNSGGEWKLDKNLEDSCRILEQIGACCDCPEGSVGFTEGFGCDYLNTINEVKSFSIYSIN